MSLSNIRATKIMKCIYPSFNPMVGNFIICVEVSYLYLKIGVACGWNILKHTQEVTQRLGSINEKISDMMEPIILKSWHDLRQLSNMDRVRCAVRY